MRDQLRKCIDLLDRSTLSQAILVGILVLVAAVVEAVSIGLLFPFIQFVADPARIHEMALVERIFGTLAPGTERDALSALAIGLLVLFLVKNLFLFGVYLIQARYVQANEALLAQRLFRGYLEGDYSLLLVRNSAELIRNISQAVMTAFSSVFMSFVTLGTELCLIAALAVVLLIVNPMLTLGAIALLGTAVGVFHFTVRRHFVRWGEQTLDAEGLILRSLQQGLHSVKEVKVLGCEPYILHRFVRPRRELARVTALRTAATNAPRLWVEAVTVAAVMVMVIVSLAEGGSSAEILALLTLFAAAAVRLIPSMNRILIALSIIRNGQAAVDAVHQDMTAFGDAREDADGDGGETVGAFTETLELRDLHYTYPEADIPSLHGLNLAIRKGESVGLAGPSGAGKTTLVDIILGLLRPTEGEVLVDGSDIFRALGTWRRQTGYVPQTVYLTDDTIRRNVAFGIDDDDIDEDRLARAIGLAQLDEVIGALPQGLETIVGERGVRLSGGQRQRIGIARALYNDPEVLVLDEATSSLDSATESEFASAIEGLRGAKTLIIVAHRLSTIRRCDRIILLDKGRLVDQGTFAGLSAANAQFRHMVESSAL